MFAKILSLFVTICQAMSTLWPLEMATTHRNTDASCRVSEDSSQNQISLNTIQHKHQTDLCSILIVSNFELYKEIVDGLWPTVRRRGCSNHKPLSSSIFFLAFPGQFCLLALKFRLLYGSHPRTLLLFLFPHSQSSFKCKPTTEIFLHN